MVLCSRCQISDSESEANVSSQVRPCVIREGEPCLLCKEDLELERKIQELQDQPRNLRTRMNATHDPFVLKLPPEIASHILSLSIEAQDNELLADRFSWKLPTTFLLGAVCRGWRQLARSTPQLWSTLSFTLTKPPTMGASHQLQAVRDWLELSLSLPLDLWVFDYGGENPLSQERCGPVIDILNQHSGRWHKLCLYLPAPFFSRFCGTSPPSSLWNLQLTNESAEVVSPTFKFRMFSTPSPTHLLIRNFSLLDIDIVWENLTSLELRGVAFDGWIEAIRRAPLLKYLLIAEAEELDNPAIPTTIIRHMNLRTLECYQVSVGGLGAFLDVMEFPSLEEYNYEVPSNNIAADTVISLFKRSGSHLKKLSLAMQNEPTGDLKLKELLDAVPSLRHLELHFWDSISTIIPGDLPVPLTTHFHGKCSRISPSSSIFVSFPGFSGVFTWELILRIFSWPHRKHLQLTVITSSEIDNTILYQIAQLIDQGFNIRILTDGKDYL